MAEDNFAMGYALGQDSNGGGNGGGGMFNGDAFWGIILLALLFGGGRGFGGGFGGGGGSGGGDACCCVKSAIADSFAVNNITEGVRSLANGISDATFALNNSIMGGFHGVDNAICTLGYQTQQGFNTLGYQNQQGFNTLGYQMKDCCCETQRLIERGFADTNYNLSTQFCGLQNTMNNNTRDIIESQNSGTRAILDFLVQEKLADKDAKIAQLQNQVSQSNQNAVIRAAIDASTAEIIRRTGNDCPVPSYLVQPPTPVNFPINGCGTVQFGGGYGNNGCGCGCGC